MVKAPKSSEKNLSLSSQRKRSKSKVMKML